MNLSNEIDKIVGNNVFGSSEKALIYKRVCGVRGISSGRGFHIIKLMGGGLCPRCKRYRGDYATLQKTRGGYVYLYKIGQMGDSPGGGGAGYISYTQGKGY